MSTGTRLVSIHDVCPATLPDVQRVLDRLQHHHISPVTLLVIPGKTWQARELAQLRAWQADGAELAGHGWSHQCLPPKDWRHYLHSKCISRDVAEHYSCNRQQSIEMLRHCHHWFTQNGFAPPRLYVPPAWTLGHMPIRDLSASPFDLVEVLGSLVWTASGKKLRLPVVGFEADTAWRQGVLTLSNKVNAGVAAARHQPLRIAIHPRDFCLRLAHQLDTILAKPATSISYGMLLEP